LIQYTQRESEVLVLLAHGLSNKTIALRLGISPHTVRDHVCSLMQWHGLSNRVQSTSAATIARPWSLVMVCFLYMAWVSLGVLVTRGLAHFARFDCKVWVRTFLARPLRFCN